MNLYGSYDAFVGGGGAQDLYGSYDAMPGAPGGGGSYEAAYGNYNSYDSYIGNAGYGMGGGFGMDPYAGGYGYNPLAGNRAPNPNLDYQDIRGVGITFDQKPSVTGNSSVYVKRVARGSSADRTGRVKPGDILLRVNGMDFHGRPIADLRPVIPGPAGTTVRLSFRRYDGAVYDVDLKRTTPRLGSKNSRYYSGVRANPGPSMQQQQMMQQQMMMRQQQQMMMMQQQQQQPMMMDYGMGYGGMTMMAPQTYGYADSSYVLGGNPMVSSVPMSYIAQPAVTYAPATVSQPVFATNQVTYTTEAARPDEIKGTQV